MARDPRSVEGCIPASRFVADGNVRDFLTIDRPTTRTNPVDDAKFEVPALRCADLGDGRDGLSLINDSKYGYDAAGNVLRLSLLRSPVYPDLNADRGRQVFRYALYPHTGTWQQAMSTRRGWEFNYPLQAAVVTHHLGTLGAEHSFVGLKDNGVVLTAIKRSEDGNGLIVRMFDWSGKASQAQLTLPQPAQRRWWVHWPNRSGAWPPRLPLSR